MITAKQYARALYEAIQETAPADHDKVLDNFVAILSQNGAAGIYDDIEAEYRSLDTAGRGIQEVVVTTAHDSKQDTEVIAELNRLIGKKIEIKRIVDENLVGGIVVRAGDTLIDGSIASSIRKLAKEMES